MFLSLILFDGCNEVASHAQYHSPCKKNRPVSIGLVGFAGDCNGPTNPFLADGSEETLNKVFHQAQPNAQSWSDLLHASGGSLELSKCSCHIMHWLFSAQGAPVFAPKNSSHQGCLKVTDQTTGREITFEIVSPYQAHKTLGHYNYPAGTQKEQYQQLKT